MSKRKKNPLLEALQEGRSYTWTIPEGGNLASMRKAVKHGQTLTMSPIVDIREVRIEDIVLVKWYQSNIFHIVGDIKDGQFLIVNSLGKENGWVEGKEILGKITNIVEPEPRPNVPILLKQLEDVYQSLNQNDKSPDYKMKFSSILSDLEWYADRIGRERWDIMPRDNIWSFHQNLWRLTRRAKNKAQQKTGNINKIIDEGKRCVGLASEIVSLFEEKGID